MQRTLATLALAAAAFTSTMAHGQDDHGDATSSATCLSLPSATAGTIDPGNDIDYFRFAVSRTTAVVMETTGSLDTVGRFYDSNGRQVTGNHNSGEGGNFRIARELSAGTYYVRVDSNGNRTGDYTLQLRGDHGDHGDATSSATCVAVPSATAGTIDPGNDIDYFRFAVPDTTAVVMETTGSLDTVGRLYDSNGRQLTGNHNSGEGGNFRIARELTQGEYYAYVGSYGGGTGDYTLQLHVEGVLSIATDGPSTVPPLATVPLTVLGGEPDAEYLLFMDLSGGGEFADDDTIEVTAVVSGGRLLVAAPLPETLAEGNATRRFAVRVRERDGDGETAPLTFTLGRVNMPENLAGYPTVVLEVLLKGVYQGLDDPLLTVEAGAIDPGRSVRVAETLGLSMAYSDAQAEAILRSMFGVSITEASASGIGTAPSTHDALRRTGQAEVVCDVTAGDDLCDGYKELVKVCVGDALNSPTVSAANSAFRRCVNIVITEIVPGWLGLGYLNRKIRSFGDFLSRTASRLVDHIVDDAIKTASQKLFDSNAAARQIGLLKTLRTMPQTPAEAQKYYEALRGISQSLTERNPDLVAAVEREAATNGVDGDKRGALSELVDEGDHNQRDAAALDNDGLEDVYTGEADVETLGSGDTGGTAACGDGYDKFYVDEKTSTCVWSSLVEPSCYAGSRQVSNPDLGSQGANYCLYYSLDYFQTDGSCRENYAKVTYQGRETCRWAELGADKEAWYTVGPLGIQSPKTLVIDNGDDGLGDDGLDDDGLDDDGDGDDGNGEDDPDEFELPGGGSLTHPKLPDFPPAPNTDGVEVGCNGDRDGEYGPREGKWVCVWSDGDSSFSTYSAGVLNGESGAYNADGEPRGSWGKYQNAQKEGVWWFFWSDGDSSFSTYSAGVLNGESGAYNADGEPRGSWGKYQNAQKEGVWWFFWSDGDSSFSTYSAGVLNGESGAYNADGEKRGCWRSYTNGQRGPGTFYWSDGTTSEC